MFKKEALQIIKESCTDAGFVATASGDENYNRIWSRDSAITGLAVLLHKQEELYPYIKKSILTLHKSQHQNGLIPSNVAILPDGSKTISYGTLVGRVDAQTWWLIQSCLYLLHTEDELLRKELKESIGKVLEILDVWEFNARDLIYTPLGGNWADEYVLSGYTLYDNLLRLWALQLTKRCYPSFSFLEEKITSIHEAIHANFIAFQHTNSKTIQPRIFEQYHLKATGYLPAAFDAAQYCPQWDAAANALALLLGFPMTGLLSFLKEFKGQENGFFVPAFWPVIEPKDSTWYLLENQYNYQFKNTPYHFHNGGSWPVMSGLLAMGLQINSPSISAEIKTTYEQFLIQKDQLAFSEYISTDDFRPGGKKQMCFSASGYLFMSASVTQINSIFQL